MELRHILDQALNSLGTGDSLRFLDSADDQFFLQRFVFRILEDEVLLQIVVVLEIIVLLG